MSDNGRRFSKRAKNPINRLGNPVDSSKLRKKPITKGMTAPDKEIASNCSVASTRRSLDKEEIDLQLTEALNLLQSKPKILQDEIKEITFSMDLLRSKMDKRTSELQRLKDSKEDEAQQKILEDLIQKFQDELSEQDDRLKSKTFRLGLANEEYEQKKVVLEKRAEFEKKKVDFEEDSLGSVLDEEEMDKNNATMVWAEKASKQQETGQDSQTPNPLNLCSNQTELETLKKEISQAQDEQLRLEKFERYMVGRIDHYMEEIQNLQGQGGCDKDVKLKQQVIAELQKQRSTVKNSINEQRESIEAIGIRIEFLEKMIANKKSKPSSNGSGSHPGSQVSANSFGSRNSTPYENMAKAFATAMATAFPKGGGNQSNSDRVLARQIQGRDLPNFTGKIEEWPAFINAFETSTNNCQFSDAENLIRLQRCLKGEALELVQCLLVDAKGVETAVDQLRKRFGRPSLIIKAMICKLNEMPPIKFDRYDMWAKFGVNVNNLLSTIQSLRATEQLSNPSLVEDLLKKLPPSTQMEWEEFRAKKKVEFPNLQDFAEWIRPKTEAAFALCPVGSSSDSTKEKSKPDNARADKKSRFDKKGKVERAFVTSEKSDKKERRPFVKREKTCTFCEEKHHNKECHKFKNKDEEARYVLLKESDCCFGCTNFGHALKDCRSKKVCGIDGCVKYHHPMLHRKKKPTPMEVANHSQEKTEEREAPHPSTAGAEVGFKATQGNNINYNVVPIFAKRKDGSLMPAYAALDIYSSFTSASNFTMKDLGIEGVKRPLTVKGFQATTTTDESFVLDIEIVSKVSNFTTILKGVKTVPDLDLPSQSVTPEMVKKYKHLQEIPLETYKKVLPTILIGMDNFELHFHREIREGKPGEPVAIRTDLGWAVVGPTPNVGRKPHHAYHMQERMEDPLHHLVKQIFTTESVGVKHTLIKPRSKEDIRAQAIMVETVRRVNHGWESGLLWKEDGVSLPYSKTCALNRLRSMERKMDKDPEFGKQYVERIQEYVSKGFARKLDEKEVNLDSKKIFYLPHFMAYNEKKPKKFRFVFDAAAKVGGFSLNDHLLQGPDKLVSLPGALLKFRQRRIGLVADIKDMFHRVRVRTEDAVAQRFLWRGLDRVREPDVYEMGVLIFGSSSSPACAQEAKNKNAEEFKEEFPEAYEAIVHRHYMDDLLDSCHTEAQAIKLQQDVTEVHRRGSFQICNWMSNSTEVMAAIPEELRAKSSRLNISLEDEVERVLGLFWVHQPDEFTFCQKFLKAKDEVINRTRMPTKRELLSLVMSIFDPLGFVSILTVKAKMILQATWRSQIGWDDEIPTSTHEAWITWLQQLSSIETFKIPRCYSSQFSTADETQLHVFCDASEEAFGCVAYFRIRKTGPVETALVMAKSNVAPLKHLTIPRLELQAALLAARMAGFIHEQHEIPINRTIFWSDSTTVLDWIRADGKRFQQFVGNRIGEIQDLTSVIQWKWIPTDLNVADELTRMKGICDWSPDSRWVNGPEFLKEDEQDWPVEKPRNRPTEEAVSEMKKDEATSESKLDWAALMTETTDSLDPRTFSCLVRLHRITALVFRFIRKCQKRSTEKGHTKVKEMKWAEEWLIKKMQLQSFKKEIKLLEEGKQILKESHLASLSVHWDGGDNCLLRVGGRLENSSLPESTKKPIIMDPKHPYTRLMTRHFHERFGHHGQERIANEIRQQFHVIGLRVAVRSAQDKCQDCKNRRAVPAPPEMGQLPKFRVEDHGIPFKQTGLDYFGPVEVVVKRSKVKRYVALFTCLATRAVHLELAGFLSTDSCIMALRRFFARRGFPATIHSDNGSNFVGANNELKAALNELRQSEIENTCTNKGVEWHFIPPKAAHMGGS